MSGGCIVNYYIFIIYNRGAGALEGSEWREDRLFVIFLCIFSRKKLSVQWTES